MVITMESSKLQTLFLVIITGLAIAGSSRGGGPSKEETKERFMSGHNRLRACEHLADLKWEEKLADEAREFVKKHKRECCEAPPNPTKHGENFYCYTGEAPEDANPFGYWDWQKVGYVNTTQTCTGDQDCFGYLQAVSPVSVYLGCAQITCDCGGTLSVCYYDPPAKGAPFPRPPLHTY